MLNKVKLGHVGCAQWKNNWKRKIYVRIQIKNLTSLINKNVPPKILRYVYFLKKLDKNNIK